MDCLAITFSFFRVLDIMNLCTMQYFHISFVNPVGTGEKYFFVYLHSLKELCPTVLANTRDHFNNAVRSAFLCLKADPK
jgi:hypothetical protein